MYAFVSEVVVPYSGPTWKTPSQLIQRLAKSRHAFGDEISLFFNILWFYQSGMNCLSSFVVQFTLFLLYILSILAMHTYAHYFICNLVSYI